MQVSIEGKLIALQVLDQATNEGRLSFEEDRKLRAVIISEYHKDCDAALEELSKLAMRVSYEKKYQIALQCAKDFRDIVLEELNISNRSLNRRIAGDVKFRVDEVDKILKRCGFENLL